MKRETKNKTRNGLLHKSCAGKVIILQSDCRYKNNVICGGGWGWEGSRKGGRNKGRAKRMQELDGKFETKLVF